MLKRSIVLLAGSIWVLAGCGQDAGSAPDDSGTTKSTSLGASGEQLRAGLYRIVQTGDVDIEEERCLKSSDVEAGRFVVPGMTGDGWTFDTNRMSGGTIEVAAHHPSGGRLNIDGTFEKESFAVDGRVELKLNGETHVVRTQQRGVFASPTCPDGMG